MSELLIILLLVALNGLLAMSEIALISARKAHLAQEAKRGSRSARTALRLAGQPEKFLSTIQIGITAIGILTGLYSGSVLADDFAQVLRSWGVPAGYAHGAAQATIVVGVTYLTLIFGELVPKRIGMSVAERAAKFVARPMNLLSAAASPFVWVLAKSTSAVFRLFGFRADESRVTEAEIKLLVEEGTKDGEVQQVEQQIVERVFLLGDLKVRSLMTHRTEAVALSLDAPRDAVRETIRNRPYGLYPVVGRTLDDVRGVALLKDLFFELERGDFRLERIVLPAFYVYEHTSVYQALASMKERRASYALICDEFGSFQGIVTLKDILEGLVGAIENPHDAPDIVAHPNGQGWLVDGQCPLHEFLSYFDREELYPTSGGTRTVGGLLIDRLGRLPECGERVVWHDFTLTVVGTDGVRIDQIAATLSTQDS